MELQTCIWDLHSTKDHKPPNFSSSGKKSNFSRICFLLTVLLSLALMIKIFLVDWDLLEVDRYLQSKACNESIFNVNCDRCLCETNNHQANCCMNDWWVESVIKTDQTPTLKKYRKHVLNYYNSVNSSPSVFTKCGRVQSKLISKYTVVHQNGQVSNKTHQVPNILHYVSLGKWKFTFLNYLSFKSSHFKLRPKFIIIHGDGLPHGEWWEKTAVDVPNIYFAKRDRPVRIQGVRVQWIEHSSDIMRLQTVYDNGGIYLDTDVLVLRSFDPLRAFPTTLGRESSYGLGSSIIVSKPKSTFICMWLNGYKDYRPVLWNWARYAVWNPHKLARKFPQLVHIEENHLLRPSWSEPALLFKDRYDWSENYAIHVWHRYGHVPETPAEIENLNTTLGEIMRFIFNN